MSNFSLLPDGWRKLCDLPVGRQPDGIASIEADPSVEGVGLLS